MKFNCGADEILTFYDCLGEQLLEAVYEIRRSV